MSKHMILTIKYSSKPEAYICLCTRDKNITYLRQKYNYTNICTRLDFYVVIVTSILEGLKPVAEPNKIY